MLRAAARSRDGEHSKQLSALTLTFPSHLLLNSFGSFFEQLRALLAPALRNDLFLKSVTFRTMCTGEKVKSKK